MEEGLASPGTVWVIGTWRAAEAERRGKGLAMNDGSLIVLALAAIVVVMVAVLAVQHHREQERRERLRSAARDLGFSFSLESDPRLPKSLGHFHLFSQGRSKRISNVMSKAMADIDVTIFDYKYTTGSGKHSDTRNQTVVLFESERLQLPSFALRPEHLFHKLAGAMGYQDIDFDAFPEFSQTYLLQGYDEERIRSLFTDEVLSYYARHTDLCTEGDEQQLLYYRARKRVDPEWIGSFVEEGLDVLALFLEKEGLLGSLELVGASLQDIHA
jgi:hypothetical protein